MQQHSGRGIHPLLQPLFAVHSSTSIPGGVHPLLQPLYAGHSSTSPPKGVHPLLQPLFSETSSPSLVIPKPNFDGQPEIPASCDLTNLQPSPATDTTAKCVMTKRNHENSLPEEVFVVDMEMLPFPLNISKALAIPNKTTKDDLNVGIIATTTSVALSTAISCPTNNHASYSVANTMLNWFTVAAVTEFSFKWVETVKTVNKVKLGEPPPWIGV
jgi:hypothetical protein